MIKDCDISASFNSTYRGKTVLITGHTGFKGSWLSYWLSHLGARIVGVSLDPPTNPSLFDAISISGTICDQRLDIRDASGFRRVLNQFEPDYIFHLAAQPLVSESYIDPLRTWSSNVNGTLSVLEALRDYSKRITAVLITSDKCYKNHEWVWGYRESDLLGGEDIYSASKAAAEILAHAYISSFFKSSNHIRIATARAGNVIGGGDWAADRLIPDLVRAWTADSSLLLRNPGSTRPWQHVLEPLSGYLTLATHLDNDPQLSGQAFNFGPDADSVYSVLDVVRRLQHHLPQLKYEVLSQLPQAFKESNLLKLVCDKAQVELSWRPTLDFENTIKYTADWYSAYYKNPADAANMTLKQISSYTKRASQKSILWSL